MKKILFLGLLLAGLLIVYGCVPPEQTEDGLPGEEQGALAGQAISLGCTTVSRNVQNCTEINGGIQVTTRTGTRTATTTLMDKCGQSGQSNKALDYSCIPGKRGGPSIAYQRCRTQCESGEVCQEGVCVTLPPPPVAVELCDGADNTGDGVIDEGCDDDNDGQCDSSMTFTPVSGTSTCGGVRHRWNSNCCDMGGEDCNDLSDNVFLGLTEICSDSIDNNCDGIVNEISYCHEALCDDLDNDGDGTIDDGCFDYDGDGYCASRNNQGTVITVVGTPTICPNGGGDCIDGNAGYGAADLANYATSYPGAAENCFDHLDTNCDLIQDTNVSSGCAPYTCTEPTETSREIRAANGQTRIRSDSCIVNTTITNLVQVQCSSPPTTPVIYWLSFERSTNTTCPSGTVCTDPDGPTGATPAVCS